MDHQEIAERNVIDRYLEERLTEEEEARFEEHLVDCAECFEQVRWGEDFRRSLRTAAAEDAQAEKSAALAVEVGLLAWLARRSRLQRGAIAWGIVLLALLPALWLLRERGRLQKELASARAEPAVPAPTTRIPEEDPVKAAAVLAERKRLEDELSREKQANARLEEELRQAGQPQMVSALVSLGFVRGSSDEPVLRLGRSPGWIVLSVEPPAEERPAYRIGLRTAGGKLLWQGDRIEAGPDGSILVSLPARFLEPGSYRLRIEGIDESGSVSPAGEIPFRVAMVGEG